MSTLVEMIEALQSEWFGVIEARKKNGQDGTIEAVIGMHARSLQPILAAAREQEQELAAMKEQPSTDLREIAEMASLIGKEFGQKMEQFINSEIDEQPEWQEPDSILAAFREKQHRETVCKVHGKHLCAECYPREES